MIIKIILSAIITIIVTIICLVGGGGVVWFVYNTQAPKEHKIRLVDFLLFRKNKTFAK